MVALFDGRVFEGVGPVDVLPAGVDVVQKDVHDRQRPGCAVGFLGIRGVVVGLVGVMAGHMLGALDQQRPAAGDRICDPAAGSGSSRRASKMLTCGGV